MFFSGLISKTELIFLLSNLLLSKAAILVNEGLHHPLSNTSQTTWHHHPATFTPPQASGHLHLNPSQLCTCSLTPGLLRITPLHLLPGPPTAFLVASKALMFYPGSILGKASLPGAQQSLSLVPFLQSHLWLTQSPPSGRTS